MNTDRIADLVAQVRSLPDPAARNVALDLVQAVMDLHANGLDRMLQLIAETDSAGRIQEAFAADDLVSNVLLLHDIHPFDLEARVTRALDKPEFRSRGAKVELISVADGVVRVLVEGGPALRATVEKVLANAAPDSAGIEFEPSSHPVGAADFVPLEHLLAT